MQPPLQRGPGHAKTAPSYVAANRSSDRRQAAWLCPVSAGRSTGAGNGRWNVNGDQYCESYGGKPMECGVFKNTGDAYFAANSRLVEMKV